MDTEKQREEASLIGRLLSLELLLMLMGCVSLFHGIIKFNLTNILLGLLLFPGAILLLRHLRKRAKGNEQAEHDPEK